MSQGISNVTAINPSGTGSGSRGSLLSGAGNSSAQTALAPADDSLQQAQLAVSALTDYYSAQEPNLKFRLDEDRGDLVISVIDSKTGSVLSQIPNEDVRRILDELARSSSSLVDKKV